MPNFPKLEGDANTEVLIIGGGITGILCAYLMEQSNVDYILVEADTICRGITKDTTAKITSQHGLIYHKLIRRFGVERAKMYLDANEQAIGIYRDLCGKIDCDFELQDSYVYSMTENKRLHQEMRALELLQYPAQYVEKTRLPFAVSGAVRFQEQAHFHPLKFLAAIAKNLKIYEHTKVCELGTHKAVTNQGTIHANHIIVATHYPMLNKHGGYFLKIYQNRSYVLALSQAEKVDGMYVDEADRGLSFRDYEDLLLLGGGSHRPGKSGGKWDELIRFADEYYPQSQEVARWATQDCMTLDEVPYIGTYTKNTEGLYVAAGFNKWGMTSSMVAAMILRDMVQGRNNEYAEVVNPNRSMLRTQLVVNIAESTVNMASFFRKRCPHMGCALRWNPEERTWDCPCHGSRFTEDGQLIDNPATDDKE